MKDLWKKYGRVCAVLLAAAVLFAVGRALAAPEKELPSEAEEFAEYETAVVRQILTDSTEYDPISTGHRGGADAAGGGHLRAV